MNEKISEVGPVINTTLRIAVNAASAAEANRLATELEQWLKGRVGGIEFTRVKEDSESQDAGSVLVAVLAAPAMIEFAKGPALELAKGVADWLRRRRATLTVGPDGSVTAENVDAASAERIILDILTHQRERGTD
ncbi:hypothetical protein [Ralstonia pseudosolanacearum]|uniref:hypothetical protein n=1 Tax=Ralstonia pseudosolanacearum TaxID=1310165 RepID=UPI0005786880